MAKDTKNDDSSAILMAISKNNLYDGVLEREIAINRKRKLIAIRKKKLDQVCIWNIQVFPHSDFLISSLT